MRLASAIALGFAVSACGRTVVLPPPFDGADSVALVLPTEDGPRLEGVMGSSPWVTLYADVLTGEPIFALRYDASLEALALGPGSIRLLPEGTKGARRVPEPVEILVADVALGTWAMAETSALDLFRIDAFDSIRCIDLGLCVDDRPSCASCDGGGAISEPTMPTPPCPPTWLADVAPGPGGLITCRPTAPARAPCPPGQRQAIDAVDCTPVGECAAGEWPRPRSTRPRLFVRQGAVGGDGTMAAPLGSLAAAVANAATEVEIAVARGTYVEALDVVQAGLHFVGACPAETIWRAPNETAIVASSSTSVHSIRLEGPNPIQVPSQGILTLRGVHVAEGAGVAALVAGTLYAEDVVVDRHLDGIYGNRGARIELRDVQLVGSDRAQLTSDDADVFAVRARVVAGGPEPGCQSSGVVARQGGQAEVAESIVEEACHVHVGGFDPGTRVTLSDVLIRNAEPEHEWGIGIVAWGFSSATIERVGIINVAKGGLSAVDSEVTGRDVVIAETRASDEFPVGLYVRRANVELDRVFLDRNAAIDLGSVFDEQRPSSVTMSNWLIRSLPTSTPPRTSADTVTLSKGLVEGPVALELNFAGPGTVEDLTLIGQTLEVGHRSGAILRRVRVNGAQGVGLHILAETCGLTACLPMEVSDLAVRDISAGPSGLGIGMELETVLPISLDRFSVERAAYGVTLVDSALVRLSNGRVIDSKIGLVTPNFPDPVSDLLGSVAFERNGRNIQIANPP